jgi:HPt (histidine-containing phosphotransfer) domain-containing protein
MPEDKLRFEQYGLQGHIEKPLDKKELLRVLSCFLKASTHNGTISRELDKYLDAESGRELESELGRELSEELEGESHESIAREVTPSVVINTSCLDTLAADTSEEVLPQLVEIFTQDAKQRLDQLANSHEKDVIERHLHTLGSSAALYGLTACSDRARQLERCLIEGKDASAELPTFVRLCEQSLEALTQAVGAR